MKTSRLDTSESFWSIGCILGMLGIPGMIVGGQIARDYGVSYAIFSICIGNLILWILGLGIISMTHGKDHAIDNIKKHFGKWSGYFAALILSLDFLMWFTFQLSITANTLSHLFHFEEEWKIGISLGLLVSLLSIGGFKTLKYTCLIALPLIVGITLYSLDFQSARSPIEPLKFSYSGIFLVMMAYLSGMINLPTFFRHSRSKADSKIALFVILFIHTAFQTLMVFSKLDASFINILNGIQENISIQNLSLITVFTLALFFCINLVNIYFVSACWEAVFPRDSGVRKYVIFGILGTFAYIYLRSKINAEILSTPESIMNYSMTILLVSLLINYLISLAVKHRLRYLDKFLGSVSWMFGCGITIINLLKQPNHPEKALLSGLIATLLFSVAIVFIEETIWSIRKLRQEN